MTLRTRSLTEDIQADTWHCGASCSGKAAALDHVPGCKHAALCLIELGDEETVQALKVGIPVEEPGHRRPGFFCTKYSQLLDVDKSGDDVVVRPFRCESCLLAEYPRRSDVHTGKPLARIAWADINRAPWNVKVQ